MLNVNKTATTEMYYFKIVLKVKKKNVMIIIDHYLIITKNNLIVWEKCDAKKWSRDDISKNSLLHQGKKKKNSHK